MHSLGHIVIYYTFAYDLNIAISQTFQGSRRFAVWFLSYLGNYRGGLILHTFTFQVGNPTVCD